MKKNVKRWISIALLIAMAVALVACGSAQNGNTSSPSSGNNSNSSGNNTGSSGNASGSSGNTSVLSSAILPINKIKSVDMSNVVSSKDTLVWGQTLDPGSLNMYKSFPTIYASASYNVTERCAIYDDSLNVYPHLAEKWWFSDDEMKFYVKMREGVQFSNGKEMTAEDAMASLPWLFDSTHRSDYPDICDISTLKAEDKYTWSIELTRKCLYLEQMLTKLVVFDKDQVERDGDQLGVSDIIGTGPYVVDEYVRDVHIVLVKNTNYWDKDYQPKLEKIIVRFIPEASVGLVEMENGNLDFFFNPTSVEVTDVLNNPRDNMEVFMSENIQDSMLCCNTQGVLGDLRLRQALAYGMNKEAIHLAVYNGIGEVAYSNIRENEERFEPKLKDYYTYDVNKAKELLADAGYANGLTLKMICSTAAVDTAISEMLLNQFNDIGITLQIEYTDNTSAATKMQNTLDYDLAILTSAHAEEFGPSQHYNPTTAEPLGGINKTKIKYLPEAERLTELWNSLSSLTKEERIEAWKEIQLISFGEQCFWVPIHHQPEYYLINSSLRGVCRFATYQILNYAYFE